MIRTVCLLFITLPLVSFFRSVDCVDRSKFKSCSQSAFCKRLRRPETPTSFVVDPKSLNTAVEDEKLVELILTNSENDVKFRFQLMAYTDNIFRFSVKEVHPLYKRYEIGEHVLVDDAKLTLIHVEIQSNQIIVISVTDPKSKAVITMSPSFKVSFYYDSTLIGIANDRQMLQFEHSRHRQSTETEASDEGIAKDEEHGNPDQVVTPSPPSQSSDEGLWEESFGGNTDSKPRGPQAIGLDFTFINSSHIYGIPEHADSFNLKDTIDGDPYRLYNLDVFEYETYNPMTLYANIPLMMSHSFSHHTSAFFWMNAAETWVDIERHPHGSFLSGGMGVGSKVKSVMSGVVDGVLGSISNLVGSSGPSDDNVGVTHEKADLLESESTRPEQERQHVETPSGNSEPHIDQQQTPSVSVHWMSETGVIDVFILLGPNPSDVSRQYARLTGVTPLPVESTLAYHQCRWNYNDEEDLLNVVRNFDAHQLPVDTVWLDIEHTLGRRYFTWDMRKFPDPLRMINTLASTGRKLVTIVDPHIKKDDQYRVYKELKDLGLYVKDKSGSDYEGWCWPGSSYYPDFLNPNAIKYFADQYHFDKYTGTNLNVFIWNDMNEPSVFSGPEVTMPKDLIHMGDVEHREIHNLYGQLYTKATHDGQLVRSDFKQRPFTLTRAGFAGTQRTAAIWTGDNTASYEHLRLSVPMCLSLSIAGLSFCGADIGGFFGDPEVELLVRWYQAAAFQPFFRSHAHIDTKRREPYLLPEPHLTHVRSAIQLRYSYLPYWYTLFFEASTKQHGINKYGLPPMRPVWYEFPSDERTFASDSQHMVGEALLVHPITSPQRTSETVYFPSSTSASAVWYDIHTYEPIFFNGDVSIEVHPDHIPVYQRSGTIIPKKERPRRASTLMVNDPYTLVIALDAKFEAHNGSLYIDDGLSLDNPSNYLYITFQFKDFELKGKQIGPIGGFKTDSWLERVVILGLPKQKIDPSKGKATLRRPSLSDTPLEAFWMSGRVGSNPHNSNHRALVIRKPGFNMASPSWSISLKNLLLNKYTIP